MWRWCWPADIQEEAQTVHPEGPLPPQVGPYGLPAQEQLMAVTREVTQQLTVEHGRNGNDTGRTEVQVAIITARIASLTEHFKRFPKDNNSKRGLLRMVGKRRRLLRYLQRNDIERYRAVIQKLSLRK